jgi:phosphotransferase system  glucose/maltose/N-acetylglucosamine-specific IIC component
MQRMGRSLMLPVAVLPAASVLPTGSWEQSALVQPQLF